MISDSEDIESDEDKKEIEQYEQQQQQQQFENDELYLIENAQQYFEWAQKQKRIKIMKEQVAYDQKVKIYDISLHKKGPLEDKIYSINKMLRLNVRRGNSVCQLDDNQYFFIRRGMIKFYDFMKEFIIENCKLNHYQERVKNITFQEIQKVFSEQKDFMHIYLLFKENGEHCQIGYFKELDSWVIGSKNVTLLLRDESDIKLYYTDEQDFRFFWGKVIALEWFSIIGKKNQSEVEKIKQKLSRHTLVGEYCGNPKYQHITIYDKIQIIFYALVNNQGEDACIPVDEAKQIVGELGFDFVKTQEFRNIQSFKEFQQILIENSEKIGRGEMSIYGEGSVAYFVKENKQDKSQRTISLCKLKSVEYLIYRKLREMLKNFYLKKLEGAGKKNSKFKSDITEICKEYAPPQPIQHYLEIGAEAFSYLEQNLKTISWQKMRNEFVSFLKKIQDKVQKNKLDYALKPQQITPCRIIVICPPALVSDKTLLQIQKKFQIKELETVFRENQPFKDSYNLTYLQMFPRISEKMNTQKLFFIIYGFTKSGFNQSLKSLNSNQAQSSHFKNCYGQYIQSKDKEKSLQFFFDKSQTFIKEITQKLPNQFFNFNQEEDNDDKLESLINEKFTQFSSTSEQQDSFEEKKVEDANLEKEQKQQINQQINTSTQKQKLAIILPMSIPGSGKSFLCEQARSFCEQNNISFTMFSADGSRQKMMENLEQNNQNQKLSQQQLFEATQTKEAKQKFKEEMHEEIKKLVKGQQKNNIFYIDRGIIPQIIEDQINTLKEIIITFENDIRLKIFLLFPKIQNKKQQKVCFQNYDTPFSVTYLLNCLDRALKRGNHPTFSNQADEIVQGVVKYFHKFKGFREKQLQQKQNHDIQFQYYDFPFTYEEKNQNLKIDENLLKLFQQAFSSFEPNQISRKTDLFKQIFDSFIQQVSQNLAFQEFSEEENQSNLKDLMNFVLKNI